MRADGTDAGPFHGPANGVGADIISATSGSNVAKEGALGARETPIQNGVFTHFVLRGLKTMAADGAFNGRLDGTITIGELKVFLESP